MVIGAGSSGAVVAARASEHPALSVCLSRIRACCETTSLGRLMLWASRASLRTTLLKRCRPCSDLLKVSEAMVEPAKGCGSNVEIAAPFHNRSICE